MQNLSRQILGLTCVVLAACAAAPSFEDDGLAQYEAPGIDGSSPDAQPDAAALLDAGAPAGFDAAIPVPVPVGFDAGFSGLPAPVDSGISVVPDASASVVDAGADARVVVSVPNPPVTTPAPDASVVVVPGPEAGTGGGAATCNPQSCNNDCFLLPRCCNEANECACFSPLTQQCSLPSL